MSVSCPSRVVADQFSVPLDLIFAGPRLQRIEFMTSQVLDLLHLWNWQSIGTTVSGIVPDEEKHTKSIPSPPGLEPSQIVQGTVTTATKTSSKRREREKKIKTLMWNALQTKIANQSPGCEESEIFKDVCKGRHFTSEGGRAGPLLPATTGEEWSKNAMI